MRRISSWSVEEFVERTNLSLTVSLKLLSFLNRSQVRPLCVRVPTPFVGRTVHALQSVASSTVPYCTVVFRCFSFAFQAKAVYEYWVEKRTRHQCYFVRRLQARRNHTCQLSAA